MTEILLLLYICIHVVMVLTVFFSVYAFYFCKIGFIWLSYPKSEFHFYALVDLDEHYTLFMWSNTKLIMVAV